MADPALGANAEARLRRGALLAWRVALFLASALTGALVWAVVLEPAWYAASLQQQLSADAGALARRIGREALDASPAILLTLAVWDCAAALRRIAHGAATLARSAGSLAHAGVAVLLAGLMQAVGRPSIEAWLDTGGAALLLDPDPAAAALAALGAALWMLARALRDS